MTKPTYKIVQNDDLSLTVVSDNEKLIKQTHSRWSFMMNNCKVFFPDHMMDKHNFKTRRFAIVGLTEIVKSKHKEEDEWEYSFEAGTIEIPDGKSIFEAIRDHYKGGE